MKYTEEMILKSKSGYSMPFEVEQGREVEATLNYGKQTHPATGREFFHDGIDLVADHQMLFAVADGTISGVGSDDARGMYQTIRYGKYEVTYRHLSNIFANFGEPVRAGSVVSISAEMLHLEVRFDGERMSPIDFLTMLYGNVKAMEQRGSDGRPQFESFEMTVPTLYDKDRKEVEQLMMRWLPSYFEDMYRGRYSTPHDTELSLRNILSLSAQKSYFFERMPSVSNPLGIGQRAMPLAAKVQNLLIGDFLNYLALCHGVYLSTLDDGLKKKHLKGQSQEQG